MAYHILKNGSDLPLSVQPDFRRACRWLLLCAPFIGGCAFEVWRVEKRGRRETRELETWFETFESATPESGFNPFKL